MTARVALRRILLAEGLGTLMLVMVVVGSGIMAGRLTGDAALALLANTGATVAALWVLVSIFGPVSGAAFNPAVTLALARQPLPVAAACIAAQIAGGVAGTLLAHAMFAEPLLQVSTTARSAPNLWLAEVVATAGLILTIAGARGNPALPALVAAWIGAAYWATASTSFANPAVTLARTLTDTFSGIRPADAPLFILAQGAGAALGLVLARRIFAGTAP